MSPAPTPTLWTDSARTRFFLIPDDRQLPEGKFLIKTITGRVIKVEEGALSDFEVTEEQAKAWLKDEFGKMLDGARAAVDRFVAKLRGEPHA